MVNSSSLGEEMFGAINTLLVIYTWYRGVLVNQIEGLSLLAPWGVPLGTSGFLSVCCTAGVSSRGAGVPSKHQYMDMMVEKRKSLSGTSANPQGTQSLLG